MDKRNIEATRAAILEAASKLMTECSDPSEVTSRAITKEAGVNLAMINYCFGSREALLFEVFRNIREKAQQCNPAFGEILMGSLSPKSKLTELHYEAMKMMLAHFNLTKAITKYVLMNREIGTDSGSLVFIKAHFGDRKSESECRLIAYQISSMHELAVLRHGDIKERCGIDLCDDAALHRFVEENINRFLD